MLFNLVIVGLLVLLPGTNPAESSRLDMRCAAKNASTAPSYVLVTVVNAKTREHFAATVESTTLQAALAVEHELASDSSPSYYRAIDRLIDQHPDLAFEFSCEPAVERLRPAYTEVMLNDVRRTLTNLDDEAILTGFGPNGTLHRLYERDAGFWRWQPAVAHALLERGFFVGRGDYVPVLFVSRSPCGQ